MLLDPMSSIVKLVILSYKPVGCKVSVANNTLVVQQPSIVQPALRFMSGDSKADLHCLYHPIESACRVFLAPSCVERMPKVRLIFEQAVRGLHRLTDTYRSHPMTVHCLNFYALVVDYYLSQGRGTDSTPQFQSTVSPPSAELLIPYLTGDERALSCDAEMLSSLNRRWRDAKVRLVAEITEYINASQSEMCEDNLALLETFMSGIDKDTQAAVRALTR